MAEWVSVEGDFIKADVIRWHEPIYGLTRRKNRKPIKLGERRVTAEVLSEAHEDGWVHLLVRRCEILSQVEGKTIPPLKIETEVKRAEKTIMRGEPERLTWSDENARSLLASRFLGNREPLPSVSVKKNKPRKDYRYKRSAKWKPPKR